MKIKIINLVFHDIISDRSVRSLSGFLFLTVAVCVDDVSTI